MSWRTIAPDDDGPEVPTEPFSSKSAGLIQEERDAATEKDPNAPDASKKPAPFDFALPEEAGPFAVRFSIFNSYHSWGKRIVDDKGKKGKYQGGFRWPVLMGRLPAEKGAGERAFIGMPLYRERLTRTAIDEWRKTPIYSWRHVRNCFSSVLPVYPSPRYMVTVKLSERLWKLFTVDMDDDARMEGAILEMHDLAECLTRAVSAYDGNKTIYDAEALLADRAKVLKQPVIV